MKEKIKSWTLGLLVLMSLVQSYFLIYRLPGGDSAVRSENAYVKTDNMGPEEKADNLLYPEKLVIHLGGGRHTLFYPRSTFYDLIMNRLQGRNFSSFQRHSVHDFNWSQIREENPGMELTFGAGIPVTLLERIMRVDPDSLFAVESINRIWIYNDKNNGKAHAVFFSSKGDVVYEAAKADLTIQDVQQHVDFGDGWTPYTTENGEYYFPEGEVTVTDVTMPSGLYTIEQMQSSLFFDAGSTRYIREKDGSEIYTDSKRSLQVDQGQSWMSYSDPAALPAGDSTPAKDVLEAVDFVNQHGGWNGTYRLETAAEEGTDTERLVNFRQYYRSFPYGAFPVVDTPELRFGQIRLTLQQGSIAFYERSLLYTEQDKAMKRTAKLAGGDALRNKLASVTKGSRIRDLSPAYKPVLVDKQLRLAPVWRVILSDGTSLLIE